jgi:pimeloyl-ACP methyl ester carboxylesterase
VSTGPTSHTYISQRLRLHYVDWGGREKPPLLLVHGGRDHCRNWDWVAERLRDDWRVIAPDLRGHGDSDHAPSGGYGMAGYIYDLAQLVHQQGLAPVTIVAHSLGGNIALRYAGLYPENVAKLVAIEGLGPSPRMLAERAKVPVADRLRRWVDEQRKLAGRSPRRYATVEEAWARMREENPRLSPEQARHLTVLGVSQNEDGTYSWKFDNYVRSFPPGDITQGELEQLWSRITCPTLLVYGRESWASNPAEDGRVRHFAAAEVLSVEGAGHWVHHDRLDAFMSAVEAFLSA